MAGAEMKKVCKIFGKSIYYSGTGFVYHGLWYYNGTHNVRLIALNRFTEWFGDQVYSKG
jgi:hypothetical protein